MRFAGSEDKIVPFSMLKDSPHPFHVLGCISPISFCIESTEEQFLLHPVFDRGDYTRDSGLAAARTCVNEQNAIARTKPIALAVVYRRPIGERLRHPIRAARPERSLLGLRYLLRLAEHFAA